jgi:hypothetical protein
MFPHVKLKLLWGASTRGFCRTFHQLTLQSKEKLLFHCLIITSCIFLKHNICTQITIYTLCTLTTCEVTHTDMSFRAFPAGKKNDSTSYVSPEWVGSSLEYISNKKYFLHPTKAQWGCLLVAVVPSKGPMSLLQSTHHCRTMNRFLDASIHRITLSPK